MSSGKNSSYQTIVVQRDYREVITKFEKEFPLELSGRVTPNEFENTINKINQWLEKAEAIDATSVLQECIGCLTFFTFFLFFNDKYKTCVNKIRDFIKEQNEQIYNPKGITWLNPLNNGFIKIEILVAGYKDASAGGMTSAISPPSIFSSSSPTSTPSSNQSPMQSIPPPTTHSPLNSHNNTSSPSNLNNIELSPMQTTTTTSTTTSTNNNNNSTPIGTPKTPHHHRIDIKDDKMIKKPETVVNYNTNNPVMELSSDEEDSDDDAFENDSF